MTPQTSLQIEIESTECTFSQALPIHELPVEPENFLRAAIAGLRAWPKALPPRFFYDQRGSELFEKICETPEYYVTRTELRILRTSAREIAEYCGENATVIELGSGASRKTRILLNALDQPDCYVPLDISREFLGQAADVLAAEYPELVVQPVRADFLSEAMSGLYSVLSERSAERRVLFFPGSTIGNLEPTDAKQLLRRIAEILGPDGLLIIGVDLVKDRTVLEAAYDDAAGMTAAFNLNLLHRMNRELGANFHMDQFKHEARYNEALERVEMHLVSRCEQRVHVGDEIFFFRENETIHTENSHKYRPDAFEAMAKGAGMVRVRRFLDPKAYFAVFLFRVQS